jgi:hypothetical protein
LTKFHTIVANASIPSSFGLEELVEALEARVAVLVLDKSPATACCDARNCKNEPVACNIELLDRSKTIVDWTPAFPAKRSSVSESADVEF